MGRARLSRGGFVRGGYPRQHHVWCSGLISYPLLRRIAADQGSLLRQRVEESGARGHHLPRQTGVDAVIDDVEEAHAVAGIADDGHALVVRRGEVNHRDVVNDGLGGGGEALAMSAEEEEERGCRRQRVRSRRPDDSSVRVSHARRPGVMRRRPREEVWWWDVRPTAAEEGHQEEGARNGERAAIVRCAAPPPCRCDDAR